MMWVQEIAALGGVIENVTAILNWPIFFASAVLGLRCVSKLPITDKILEIIAQSRETEIHFGSTASLLIRNQELAIEKLRSEKGGAKGDANRETDGRILRQYIEAAEKGGATDQFNLGVIYVMGDGVTVNYEAAVELFRKAANQGHVGAQLRLGVMYYMGEGVRQDDVHAHMWFNIAAASGEGVAKEFRNAIIKRMPRDRFAEAQRLAREWLAQNKKPNGRNP